MTIYTRIDKTPAQIRETIELAMQINPRKRNFSAVVEKRGLMIVAGPESEEYDLHFDFENYSGLSMILRDRWNRVPGYSSAICDKLAALMMN